MEKLNEFMDKVMADEAAKAEFGAVIGARKERELSDEDFQKIVELSEKLGAAVTLDEVRDFFTGNGRELSEEELAEVAGGAGGGWLTYTKMFSCPLCGREIAPVRLLFREGEVQRNADVARDIWRDLLRDGIVHHLRLEHSDIVGLDMENAEKKAEEMINSWWEEFINEGKAASAD